ncbi:TetR/AcrR family transcriptional regulator [Sphingosinithalassobacter portus]|uniref:TetR/AcrR family transcriptional regulator n=1 Tax=Stakelama portus TaxID=2676234 RepID=UPI000D6EA7EC|nr:TetR/AcrR family transcriptional regulator [Sphingosinithalassobacter portus]
MKLEISQESCAAPAGRADARRKHLLEVARALFIERGFHRTGMAQIAEVSQVKVGQIYRDFTCKEDIIAAIVEADVSKMLREDELAEAVETEDLDTVRAWVRGIGAKHDPVVAVRDACMFAEIVAEAAHNERIANIHRSIDQRVRKSLSSALQALAPWPESAGEREQITELILALGMGMKLRHILNPNFDVERRNQLMLKVIDRSIELLLDDDDVL